MENQPQRIIIQSTKNEGLAIALAFFFGPLGLLYSTITGGIVMFIVNLIIGIPTFGFGLILTWPVCSVWAYFAAKKYNEKLMAGQNAASQPQPTAHSVSTTSNDL